jgi:hypothetical protein
MAKINPALAGDFNRLLDKVDECGRLARSLVGRGLDVGDIKKGVSRRFKVKLGTYGATKILAAVLMVW